MNRLYFTEEDNHYYTNGNLFRRCYCSELARDQNYQDDLVEYYDPEKRKKRIIDYINSQERESGFFTSPVMLYGIDFSGLNLSDMDFTDMVFRGCIFDRAFMSHTSFIGSSLYGCSFTFSHLEYVDFTNATIVGCQFDGSLMYKTSFKKADFVNRRPCRSNIHAEDCDLPHIPLACPEKGSFIGYKKSHEGYIVVLQILEDSKRLSAADRKCRCDKAKVIDILDQDGNKADIKEVSSKFDPAFVYRIGETVSVTDFDNDRWHECSTGIHFYITFDEARCHEF